MEAVFEDAAASASAFNLLLTCYSTNVLLRKAVLVAVRTLFFRGCTAHLNDNDPHILLLSTLCFRGQQV